MVDIFAQSMGLVQEGDVLSLSPGLGLTRYTLTDTANGARHKLSRGAYHVLDLLRYPISIELWMQSSAVQKLGKKRAVQLLVQIDGLSGLTVSRLKIRSITLMHKRLLLATRGIPLAHNLDRQKASAASLAKQIHKSSRILVFSLLPLGVLLYGANMPVRSFLIAQSLFLVAIAVTTFIHEYTHWILLGSDRRNAVFVRRGLRLGLLHRTQTRSNELRSALLGPLLGLLSGVAGACVITLLGGETQLALTSLVVGSFHIASWLPAYGDGKTLVTEWSQKYA